MWISPELFTLDFQPFHYNFKKLGVTIDEHCRTKLGSGTKQDEAGILLIQYFLYYMDCTTYCLLSQGQYRIYSRQTEGES